MANANQGYRSGNAFGRVANTDYTVMGTGESLKPGYLLRIRDTYALVTGVEALAVDLFFTDTHVGNSSGASALNGTHGTALTQYGVNSIQAYYDLGASGAVTAADKTGNILAPNYDSGYITFSKLEPFAGNIYHLAPGVPLQPKFADIETGNWHSTNGTTPNSASGAPIGFVGDASTQDMKQIGAISGKIYIKQPVGANKHTLDESPDGESASGSTASETTLEGISGFIDGSMSPATNPNWNYGMIIEHGEASQPAFRFVNDSDEYILDGRIRLMGWKYKILELSQDQLATLKARAGGRLRFMYYNPVTYQSSGFLSDYLSM